MRYFFIKLVFLCLGSLILSGFTSSQNPYITVQVTLSNQSDLHKLSKAGWNIEHATQHLAWIRIKPNQFSQLMSWGLPVEISQDPTNLLAEESLNEHFLSYEELTDKLHQLQSRCSEIMTLTSIGRTVQGRDMWVLKVSDLPWQDEIEPEVKLVSTIHGNEIVGQDLLVKYAEYLCDQYPSDDAIKQMVDTTQFWIMPNMNPDGTSLRQRYNADWVDLNRDFPDITHSSEGNSIEGRAIETQHMMNFQALHHFVLGATFHGGELVVNYPWDTFPELMPDIDLALFIAKEYARFNPPMFASKIFTDGVTNGYDWYSIRGGMQDWSYMWHDCLEITVEVSEVKWPLYSEFEQFWQDNIQSLLRFSSLAHTGIYVTVVDKETQAPLKATISVVGINKPMSTRLPNGNLHRLLLKGSYRINIEATGYESQIVDAEVSSDTEFTPLFIELNKSNPIIIENNINTLQNIILLNIQQRGFL